MNYDKWTKAELIKALLSLKSFSESVTSADAQQRLLHDLQVHQIELEMQNREMQETQLKLEASRDRYAELYDFAPLGYMTLDKRGYIIEINLTGAELLGMERRRLLGMRFFGFVAKGDAPRLREHLARQTSGNCKVVTDLRLLPKNGVPLEVELASSPASAPDPLGKLCRTVIHDISARKQAERALRESEARFRLMADQAPVMIWESGVDGLCTFVSKTWLDFTGRSLGQELGNGWAERVHPDDLQHCWDTYQSSLNARQPFEMEYRIRRADGVYRWEQFVHPDDRECFVGAYLECYARREPFEAQCRFLRHDGKYRWMQTSGSPRFSQVGEFLGYVGSTVDITDIKEAEEKARGLNVKLEELVSERTTQLEAVVLNLHREIIERQSTEELLRLQSFIVRHMAEGVCLVRDSDDLIVYANPRFEHMFGYGPGELNGIPATTLYYKGVNENADLTAQRSIEELHKVGEATYEVHNVRKDGTPFWSRSHAVRFDHPEFGIVFVAIHEDVTARKRVEEALSRSEENFRTLIENTSDIVSVVNADATIRYESPSLERVLGYKPEDKIGKDAFEFIHPEDVARLRESFAEIIKTPGAIRSAEYRARHRNGTWRFFETVGKSICNETGSIMIVANSRDTTDRRLADEQVQFLYRTTQAINHAPDFHEAVAIALREICNLTGLEYGEAWLPVAEGTRLECSPAWQGDNPDLLAFRKYSEGLSFAVNEGLAGRVWASQQVEWVSDLMKQPASLFRRAPLVQQSGLKSAVGVPILAEAQGVAVLVFFSTEVHTEDQRLTALFATVAEHLGATLRRKQAEQELKNSREQLREYNLHLQTAIEQERTRISREIHDELGQALTALKIDLSWIANQIPEKAESLRAKAQAMFQSIGQTIKTVQRITAELRPGLLDDLGLAAAIEWQTTEFRDRCGIATEIDIFPEDIVCDRERSTAIFRIFQEALVNVARHAGATTLKVSLMLRENKLVLKVRDNGKGITPAQIASANSFGLIGMRERVHPWGGKIKINGLSDKGTIVFVVIPSGS
ncbi:MAG: PAS domain S-box protein [bacterium]